MSPFFLNPAVVKLVVISVVGSALLGIFFLRRRRVISIKRSRAWIADALAGSEVDGRLHFQLYDQPNFERIVAEAINAKENYLEIHPPTEKDLGRLDFLNGLLAKLMEHRSS